jgi:carbamoyl-phosphate synthase large subunit
MTNNILGSYMKTNVLITGAGGAAAVSFLNAVKHDLDFNYYMGDIDPFAAGLYLVEAEKRLILPRGDEFHFVDNLLNICREYEIDVLVPTVDCELIAISESISQFREIGTRVLLADEKTLRICLDKDVLLRRCEMFVSTPRSAVLNSGFDDSDWEYPLFVKPRAGSGSRGIVKIDSPIELSEQIRDGSLLVQEYLGGEEYSVDVVADRRGKILAVVPRERLKVDSGIAVASRTLKDDALEMQAVIVANIIGLKYTANIQFKKNAKGEPCLLEVNPRFPGTMPLTVQSGVNMPLISLKDILGISISNENLEWREIAVVRTWQEHFVESSEISDMQNKAEVEVTVHCV